MPLDSAERVTGQRLAFFVDATAPTEAFRDDVVRGLSQSPKTLPPKYFYDKSGARLFEAIARMPDYYVPRAEAAAMQVAVAEIASLAGPNAVIIEPGAGAAEKIRVLLDHLMQPIGAVLIDIAGEPLLRSANRLADEFPALVIGALAGDFAAMDALPRDVAIKAAKRVIFFPGSTIGNFEFDDAIALLTRFRGWLEVGDALLIGTDAVKDVAVLDAAYNDAGGVTAAFNRNLIVRMNRELGTSIDPNSFSHEAFYVPARKRVEMHLRALSDQTIRLGDYVFTMTAGETIHTENSAKFDRERVAAMVGAAGFSLTRTWADAGENFLVSWCDAV